MYNGILIIKKEAGFTSHDVVAKLRGICKQKKIGHTGTLDPDAVGVLPVCLGKATKLCDLIGDWDKTYRAELLLGTETDTEDTSGHVLNTAPVTVTEEEIRSIILSFLGAYDQIPPMYSAKKVGGKKLYELAREGQVIERKPCPVEIKDIQILSIDLPYVTFDVTCSKGTYIRSLCRDIGKKAGCGGCMSHLLRSRVAHYTIDQAYTLAEVENYRDENKLNDIIDPIDSVFQSYERVDVPESLNKYLYNGNKLPAGSCIMKAPLTKHPVKIYDYQGVFIGIYEYVRKEDCFKPVKLFL